ncbi:IS21-like element helper ATPase IstB [Methylicorpusculum sp.]|uniref:IS21-like element helper ATPase IstB n=1 Tax=Methylicorpusculum sp. TaxID=2713644 RepID=UPI00272F7F86|nr:IS21-like element helper ATPase IstB [Methylicorpusculum sp.]MDP2180268.1 IS21-like element helper ATPase IstB [Methylicorpusculum sp.]MDP3528277.1 IS21-like element helper ATPase IstB [Methylicorpusculum sp.]MDZ4154129.1 IS21-like element helper ATPase IstB [Methylicorpusculum sp.]
MPETIDLLLKELKLPAFSRHYQRHQEQAIEKGVGHVRYLSGLCEQEVADRYQKRVQKWTREAKLPVGKSFANLNLAELSASVQQQVIALKDQTDWAHHAGNVLLIGPSGVGKSHMAAAIAGQLIEQAVRVKWFSAVALVQSLQQAKRDLDLMTAMTRLDKYQVLVIDDIGYVKKTDAETQVLFEFIAHRYESGSLIITSNQPFSQWDHIFPDTMMTVAAIDRIIHHATIIEIEGESYRKKQSLKN